MASTAAVAADLARVMRDRLRWDVTAVASLFADFYAYDVTDPQTCDAVRVLVAKATHTPGGAL